MDYNGNSYTAPYAPMQQHNKKDFNFNYGYGMAPAPSPGYESPVGGIYAPSNFSNTNSPYQFSHGGTPTDYAHSPRSPQLQRFAHPSSRRGSSARRAGSQSSGRSIPYQRKRAIMDCIQDTQAAVIELSGEMDHDRWRQLISRTKDDLTAALSSSAYIGGSLGVHQSPEERSSELNTLTALGKAQLGLIELTKESLNCNSSLTKTLSQLFLELQPYQVPLYQGSAISQELRNPPEAFESQGWPQEYPQIDTMPNIFSEPDVYEVASASSAQGQTTDKCKGKARSQSLSAPNERTKRNKTSSTTASASGTNAQVPSESREVSRIRSVCQICEGQKIGCDVTTRGGRACSSCTETGDRCEQGTDVGTLVPSTISGGRDRFVKRSTIFTVLYSE